MEWKTYKLKDICSRLSSGKNIKASEVHESGRFPVFGGNGLRGYTEVPNFRGSCSIIGRQGAYCGNVRYFSGEAYMTEHAVVAQANELADDYYLSCLLSRMHLENLSGQSAQPGLAVSTLAVQELSLPPLPTQRRIAAILSSLDAQIENNNRINRNLEEQAQALFKSWFVDFEPWGGKMPEDWKEGKLGEICTFKRGKNLLSKDAVGGPVPVIAGGMSPACYHNVANTKAPVVTVSGSGANAGYMQMHYVDVWASDCSFIDNSCKNLQYVYCFLATNPRLLRHAQTGAVQPHVKPADIHDFDIVIPTREIIDSFQEKVMCLFDMIANNLQQSSRLAQLRDTLLPKLMKGEIDINK